jgi:hypothetical protein
MLSSMGAGGTPRLVRINIIVCTMIFEYKHVYSPYEVIFKSIRLILDLKLIINMLCRTILVCFLCLRGRALVEVYLILNVEVTGGDKLEIKKIFNDALIPMAILIVLGIIRIFVSLWASSFTMILTVLLLIIGAGILVLAGYRAVKDEGEDMAGGATKAAIAASISTLVLGVIELALTVIGITLSGTFESILSGSPVFNVSFVIGLIIMILICMVIGAILGAIGVFIAKRK